MNLPEGLGEAVDRADGALVPGGYHAISVSTARVRAWLRFRRWPFVDPAVPGEPPSLEDLDRTAGRVIARSASLGSAVSGVAALGGAALVPPEAAATLVLVVRLVQRLCVVYGFDPETDRGGAACARAFAAAWEVPVPEGGALGLRVSELPALLRGRSEAPGLAGGLARAAAAGAVSWTASRLTRLLPVVSAPTQAASTRAHVSAAGARAGAVLRRLAEVPSAPGSAEDAVEVLAPDERGGA